MVLESHFNFNYRYYRRSRYWSCYRCFRTAPQSENQFIYVIQNIVGWILNIYIEIFRGTPMIVQSMVIYYGTAQAFGINLDRTLAAIFIVSINTGAYMTEIVRGGILAVDKGQFEAATALGMTHNQTMRKIVLPQVVRNILPYFLRSKVLQQR